MVIGGEISSNKLHWCIATWPSHGSHVMNQKSNENVNVPSRSRKMTVNSLGLATKSVVPLLSYCGYSSTPAAKFRSFWDWVGDVMVKIGRVPVVLLQF